MAEKPGGRKYDKAPACPIAGIHGSNVRVVVFRYYAFIRIGSPYILRAANPDIKRSRQMRFGYSLPFSAVCASQAEKPGTEHK